MYDKIESAREIREERGSFYMIYRVLAYGYKTLIRPVLPSTGYQHRGTAIVEGEIREIKVNQKRKLFDGVLPFHFHTGDETKEAGLIGCHGAVTRKNDHVVVIAGGAGKSATVAAWQVGSEGKVTVYDARSGRHHPRTGVENLRRTFELNEVDDRTEVVRAVFGDNVVVDFPEEEQDEELKHLSADELPDCDVLELDCEGAELSILEGLEAEPRVIIAEIEARHHKDFYDGERHPLDALDILRDKGYTVVNVFGHRGRPIEDEEFEELVDECYDTQSMSTLPDGATDSPILLCYRDDYFV